MALDPPNSLRRDESATAAPCIRDIDDTGTCFDQIMSEVAESVLENESGEEPIRRDTALRVLTAKCDHCVVFRANCVQALKALVDVTTQITNLEKLKPECELLRKQVAESQIQIEENLRTEHVMKARVTTAEAEASEAKARFEALEKDYDAMAKAAEEGKKHMQEAINWRLKYDRTVDVCEKLQEKRKANKESFNKILSLASNLQKDVQRCKLLRQKDKKKIAKLQSNLNRLTSAVRSYVPSLFNILETTMSSPFFKTEMPESVQVEAARLCSAEVQNVFGIDDTSVSIHVDEDDEGMTAELERLLCGVSNSSLSATNRMEFSDCPIGENLTNCSQVEHVMSDLSQLSDKEADSMLELGAEAATFSESRVIVREKSEGKKTIKKGRMTKDVGSLSATTIGANFDDFNRHYEELLATKLKRNDVTKESTKGAANSKHLSIHGKKTLSVRELQEAQMKVSIKEKVALMKLKDRERTHALGINSEDCCINDPLEQQMCSQISVQQDEKSASSNLKVNEYSLVREDLQMSSSPSPRSSVSEGETPDDITANVRTTSFLAMASEQDEESVARVFEDNEEDIEETDSSQHDLSDGVHCTSLNCQSSIEVSLFSDVTDRRVQTKVPCVPNVCMHTQVSCIPNEADKNSLIEDLFEPKIAENCMLTETSSVENLTIKHAIIERSYGSNVTENILPAEMPSAREVIDKNSLTRVSFPPNISENTILTEESYSPNEADKALLTKDLLKSNIADNCMSTEASSIWNSTVKDAIIEGLSVSKVTDNIVTTEVASVTEVIDKNELTGVLLASNVSESTIPIDVSLPANVTDSHVLTEVQCGLNVTDSSTRSEVFCVPNEGDKTLLNEELFESNLSDNRMSTKASDVRNSTVKDAVIEEFSVSEITDKTVPREMPPVTEAIDRNVRPGVLFGSNVSESTTLSEEGSLTNVINSRVLSEVPCESNVTDICMRAEVSCIPNETDKTSAEVQSVSNLDGQCMQMEVPHTSNVTVSVLVTEGFPLSDFIHKATIAEMPSVVEVTDKNISTGVLFASNVCDKTTPTEQVAPASNLTKNVTQKRLLSSSDICSYTLRNFPVVTYATDMSMLEKETSFAQKMTNSAMFSEAPSELDTVIGKSFYGETDGERNADGLGDMFCEIPVNGKKVTTSQLLCKSVGSETVSRKESMAVISEVVRIEQSGSNISVFPKKTGMEQLESVCIVRVVIFMFFIRFKALSKLRLINFHRNRT
ncbi:hypothetical protein DICVIV_04636 [Dictyocaulus viviparus]|uniref:Uncharacterized protein n=1 Tax=Dictyocaulus viviparus TaxID=29172 RepID=A0A0D8Y3X3_DICVI|nr:hypothetical protein DICVIV_04636 [Dictyocaulus viviparus]